jgi:hypothetical protein
MKTLNMKELTEKVMSGKSFKKITVHDIIK